MKTMPLSYGPNYLCRTDVIPDSLTGLKPISVQTFGQAAEMKKIKNDQM